MHLLAILLIYRYELKMHFYNQATSSICFIVYIFICYRSVQTNIHHYSKSKAQLMDYDSLARSKVMVVGTFHFDKSVLNDQNQKSIDQLIKILKNYKPTKIVLEWDPSAAVLANKNYRRFVEDPNFIADSENEVYHWDSA